MGFYTIMSYYLTWLDICFCEHNVQNCFQIYLGLKCYVFFFSVVTYLIAYIIFDADRNAIEKAIFEVLYFW